VLVVEDDELLRRGLGRAFAKLDWEVDLATTFEQALWAAEQNRPDVVALDLQLVGEWGMDLIDPILSIAPAAKIIVLTGHGTIALTNEAIQRGAKALLPKPQTAEEILRSLDVARERTERTGRTTKSLQQMQLSAVDDALRESGGNKAEAARKLGIDRRTLQRKLSSKAPPPKK
jgi:two-component system response regulator RegA